MNAVQQLLTDHIGLWTGADTAKKSGRGRAPGSSATGYGIKKLRELILELAVRGKLVSQDPSDEPASALLERIQAEKAKLVVDGKIKKDKSLAKMTEKEKSFKLPKQWTWVKLADLVALVTDGDHQAPPKAKTGVPFLVIGNLNSGNVLLEGSRFVPEEYYDKLDWVKKPTKNDILYTVTGSYGIPVKVNISERFCVQRHVAIMKAIKSTPVDYLVLLLRSRYALQYASDIATGIAQKTVPLTGLRIMPIAMPPEAEQQRIVAKVDELMALCDRLEAGHYDAADAHEKLVGHLLSMLTGAKNCADFRAGWQRISAHFDVLFTTEASIDALKQALLQLAVTGKLVPQEQSNESGSVLSKRIQRTRISKRKIVALSEDIVPLLADLLPKSWSWISIDQTSADDESAITDGPFGANLKTEHYIDAPGRRVVRLQNIGYGEFREEYHSYIDETRFEKLIKHRVRGGDLIVAGLIDTTIRCCAAPENIGLAIVKADCYKFSVHPFISPTFVRYYLNSITAHEFALVHHHGLTLTRIGLGNFRSVPVPLPPLAEQHRIVAKVDELIGLCDRLKARIAGASGLQRKLANVVVAQAMA